VTLLFTALALMAFAANSLMCRLALGGGSIDPASFTSIRLLSGAAMLAMIGVVRAQAGGGLQAQGVPLQGGPKRAALRGGAPKRRALRDDAGAWMPAVALFLYAITFSLAYVSLPVATGALILFGAVQTTMLAAAIRSGERPAPYEWGGLGVAIAGLIYLVSPGLTAPSLMGATMMAASGVAWGWYSLLGRRSVDPVRDTTVNFGRSVPLTVGASVLAIGGWHLTAPGAAFAALSGGITSGLGYVVWYAALPRLTATRAATVQLATPVLTATGGVLFLSERISPRLAVSAVLILGGISLAVFGRLRR
jgi:drug/metabolite transporter (DMT)-like permease